MKDPILPNQEPTWNETFTTDLLRKAEVVGMTVWHDATIPPDAFVANCSISLADLIDKEDQPLHDLWVSSERGGGSGLDSKETEFQSRSQYSLQKNLFMNLGNLAPNVPDSAC